MHNFCNAHYPEYDTFASYETLSFHSNFLLCVEGSANFSYSACFAAVGTGKGIFYGMSIYEDI